MLLRTVVASLLSLSLLLSTPALAEGEDGGVSDAPRIVKLESGYLVNEPAFSKLNDEVKRLQQIEQQHKSENWLPVAIVGAVVGALVAIPIGVGIGYGIGKATSK